MKGFKHMEGVKRLGRKLLTQVLKKDECKKLVERIRSESQKAGMHIVGLLHMNFFNGFCTVVQAMLARIDFILSKLIS